MMPTEEIPSGSSMTGMIEDIEPLTANQRNMIAELFDDLEVAHDHMARSCSMLSLLSRYLSSAQLMLVLKASVRPMVQLNAVQSFLNSPVTSKRKTELPDNRSAQVKLTMIPDPNSEHIKKEKANSVMCLLVATFAYKILKNSCTGSHSGNSKRNTWPGPNSWQPALQGGDISGAWIESHSSRNLGHWKAMVDHPQRRPVDSSW